MSRLNKKPELAAPAGNSEKLKTAVAYGADAVYLSGERCNLRAGAENFSLSEMNDAIKYAHDRGVKVYAAVNSYARDNEFAGLPEYLCDIADMGANAIITADPGIFSVVKKINKKIDIHISTQANTVNARSVNFWRELGAKRIILARELSLDEILFIKKNVHYGTEIETFVHGAMCMAVSGRCHISNYMLSRDANRGACAHPCRYEYQIKERSRDGEWYTIDGDKNGFELFAADDMCMVGHLPALIESGIDSFKIEGRIKSAFYVGTTVKAYRSAIDDYFVDNVLYNKKIPFYRDITDMSSRKGTDFCTGFYFGNPMQNKLLINDVKRRDYLAMVLEYDAETRTATVMQKKKFNVGDETEIFRHSGDTFTQKINSIKNTNDSEINNVPHPGQIVKIIVDQPVQPYDMICIGLLN